MRDLISLAAAGSPPAELGRIYEWYSARTVRAITTSYAVLVIALGGLLHALDDKPGDDVALIGLLAAGIVLAAVVGLFQHAELAQLPRELAEATRLVARFRALQEAGIELGTPRPSDGDAPSPPWMAWLLGVVVCAIVVCTAKIDRTFEVVVAVGACLVLPVLWARVWAELASPEPPRERVRNEGKRRTLVERIGPYRLDDYVSRCDIATYVDDCIQDAATRPRRAMPDTARRRRFGRRAR
jgi:hypothetical protein